MSDTWSGSISFTGLGSDTDWDSIIEATMDIESHRKEQMEDWQADWEEKVTALQELNQSLLDLEDWLESYDTPEEFLIKTATCTDSDAISVSAGSEAETGTHTVIVNQLAQNDIIMATGTAITDTSASLTDTDQTMTISYAGEETTIDVPAGTTAQGLVNLINNNVDLGGDVRAKLISDGSSSYLQLRGMDLGAGNTVEITASTLTGYTSSDFERTQTAQNAQIRVDGFPTDTSEWIELDSNSTEEVIPGVTMTFKDVTDADGLKITVGIDTEAIMANIEEFVAQVNVVRAKVLELTDSEVTNTVSTDTDDDEDVDDGAVLNGNYGVQIVSQNLKDIIASVGIGFESYDEETGLGDMYTTLAQLGIVTDTDQNSATCGLLIFDDTLLDEDLLATALEEDPEGVAMLFAADSVGESKSSEVTFMSLVNGTTQAGHYDISYTIEGGVVTEAYINGNKASISDDWEITGAAGTPESGLAVRIEDRTDGTHTADVDVKQGKIQELIAELTELTDTESGTLNIIADNYQDIIDGLDVKIEAEEARLDLKEQRLTEQYARVESALETYSNLETQLDSLIAQLDSD